MNFNADGYLAAGLHSSDVNEMKVHLVDKFPSSARRSVVFSGYVRHTSDLQSVPMSFNQFVGGSFVSAKEDPSDVDLLGMGDQKTIDNLSSADQARMRDLFQGPDSKSSYECDAYFLATFPETDPAYPQYRAMRKYWMGEFGFDRVDKPKGILTVTVQPNAVPSSSVATITP